MATLTSNRYHRLREHAKSFLRCNKFFLSILDVIAVLKLVNFSSKKNVVNNFGVIRRFRIFFSKLNSSFCNGVWRKCSPITVTFETCSRRSVRACRSPISNSLYVHFSRLPVDESEYLSMLYVLPFFRRSFSVLTAPKRTNLLDNMKKFKRDTTKRSTNRKITTLPSPDKSESDKKTYKVIRLANNLTALLVSDGPELYHIEDFYKIPDSSSESSYSSSSEEEIDDDPAYESCQTLENVKNDKFAACALSVNVGGFCDPAEIPGLAHFLEHMVFMGSNKYPKENQFDVFIQKHGGSTNAVTSCECTTFYFDCNVRHLFKALDMFSQFFISPLLKKESMVREREAVDSEFDLATSSDSARIEQLIGMFASDENPAGKFTWGNSRTLKDRVSENELYKSLQAFHEKYYSANLMTLAILAKLPIDTLENCALECFSQVPDRRVPKPTFTITKPLFVKERFHRMYYVHSVKDVTKLTLMWEFPPVEGLYHSKPDELISWLLAHEGKGSLLSYLKSKLWAIGLWGGITNDSMYCNSLYSLFRLEIGLSEDGFKHILDVIKATFSFIKLVQRSLPHRRIFDEIKTLSDIEFRFQEEQTTTEFVENIVEDMHCYPSKDYLTGPRLYFDYKPEEVVRLLSYIRPETVNIIVRAKEFDKSIKLDQTERWFQTKYCSKEISSKLLQTWQSVEPYAEYNLPSPNPFISNNFTILEVCDSYDCKYPVKVKSTNTMEIWHKLDTTFRLPIGCINLHFLSAVGLESCESMVMLDLFTGMLTYLLMEDAYPANMAQLFYSIEVSMRGGLWLKLKGFNDKLSTLLDTIIKCMKNFSQEFNANMFNTMKAELKKNYRNALLKRNNLVLELRYSITEEPYYNTSEKYETVSGINETDFLDFIQRFFSSAYVQCLVQGNMSRESAIGVCTESVKVFNTKPVAKKDLPYIRIRRIPIGQKCVAMKTFNDLDTNSATVNYYQWGMGNMSHVVRLELLVKLMEEKVFNVLRTKEQLGYEVYCTYRNNFGILGFTITVHSSSSKFDTSFIEERISNFMQTFYNSLSTYKSDEFFKEREALIKSKSIVYDNLKQEVEYNFREIVTEEYIFDRRWKEVDCLNKVTLKDVQNMLASIIKKGSDRNRRLTIQVLGNKAKVASPAPSSKTADQSLKIRLLEVDKKKKSYYVTDLKEFKSSLHLYRKTKILDCKLDPPTQTSNNLLVK